ncbi:hypothetical protein VN97_g12516 [Penicillium thymicola]|uniref:Uncharacterized protein n=1 Tax=Penicillium thymicola TaxID=293382 RepID=A0AAI9T5C6_PENTH|nr:hypothetical protein VN97_g12516 [Penicillium thymicola]
MQANPLIRTDPNPKRQVNRPSLCLSSGGLSGSMVIISLGRGVSPNLFPRPIGMWIPIDNRGYLPRL